jgi:hypothetical protein
MDDPTLPGRRVGIGEARWFNAVTTQSDTVILGLSLPMGYSYLVLGFGITFAFRITLSV